MSSRVELKADMFGRYSIGYDCPKCQERLISPIKDVGKPDACPGCQTILIVPGEKERSKLIENQRLAQSQREAELAQRQLDKELEQIELARAADERKREIEAKRAAELDERERIDREKREQYERERRAQNLRQCPSCKSEIEKGATTCGVCGQVMERISTGRTRASHSTFRIVGGIACAIIVIAAYFWIRNSGLRQSLQSCENYAVVNARVSYQGVFFCDSVVFDLRDGGSSSARRIDPVHLLLEFSSKLDLNSIRRVILARNGRYVFYIESSELRPLASSYAGGGRIWSFNHLPESVRNMNGTRSYSEWSGGWLGVMKEQAEDLNDFIRDWTGY